MGKNSTALMMFVTLSSFVVVQPQGLVDKSKDINVKTITITASVVLFLSSFQISGADVLKTYTVIKYSKNSESKAIIYHDPTIHSRIISVLPAGSKGVVALAKPRKYSKKLWLNVSWKGKTGWVLSKYLRYDKATSRRVNKQSCQVDNLQGCL